MSYKRSGITVLSLAIFVAGSFYFDVASIFPISQFQPTETAKFIVNSVIGSSVGVISAAAALNGLKYQQKRYERGKNRTESDIHIEDWYPKEDDMQISLTNLGEDRVKNLSVLVLVKPLRHYFGPLTFVEDDIEPEIKSKPAPLRRTGGRVGKNVDNYLQKERDVTYEAPVQVQVVDEKLGRPTGEAYPFSVFLEDLPDDVKTLTFKVVLSYNNIHDEEIEIEELFSFTSAIDLPNHVLRRQEQAPEITEFGTRIAVHPETFEEMFKTSQVKPHKGVCPPTGLGFLSFESTEIEKLRENEKGESHG